MKVSIRATASEHAVTNNGLPTAQGGLTAALSLDGAGSNDRGIQFGLAVLSETRSGENDEEDQTEKNYERSSSHRQRV
jgi:hypothetical protein